MIPVRTTADTTANFALTDGQNTSICAALPRSSNGKTTDSDSVAQRPLSPPFRNLNPICSPRETVEYEGYCALFSFQTPFELRPTWSRAQACNGIMRPVLALTSPLDAGASQATQGE
jgi:hypothetical protein